MSTGETFEEIIFMKMKKNVILCAMSVSLLATHSSLACTGFSLQQAGRSYVAKNFDRPLEIGKMLVNSRGVSKVAFKSPFWTQEAARWTSQFGSVTLNQAGINFPFSGMNEKGLVVEVLSFEKSKFPQESKLPVVSEAEWTQYILDTSSTVAEAEKNAHKVQVQVLIKGLHYLVCDKLKQCAVFEYTDGDLAVYKFKKGEVPVVANTRFPDQLKLQELQDANMEGFYKALEKIPKALNPSSAENNSDTPVPLTPEEIERQKQIDQELAGQVDPQIIEALRDEDLRRPLIARARILDRYSNLSNPVKFSMGLLEEVKLWDTRWNTVYSPAESTLWFRMFSTQNKVVIGTKRFNYACRGDGLPKGIDLSEIDKAWTMMPKIHSISLDEHGVAIQKVLDDAKMPAQVSQMLLQLYKNHIKNNYKCATSP